jgi:hypothetical protein
MREKFFPAAGKDVTNHAWSATVVSLFARVKATSQVATKGKQRP